MTAPARVWEARRDRRCARTAVSAPTNSSTLSAATVAIAAAGHPRELELADVCEAGPRVAGGIPEVAADDPLDVRDAEAGEAGVARLRGVTALRRREAMVAPFPGETARRLCTTTPAPEEAAAPGLGAAAGAEGDCRCGTTPPVARSACAAHGAIRPTAIRPITAPAQATASHIVRRSAPVLNPRVRSRARSRPLSPRDSSGAHASRRAPDATWASGDRLSAPVRACAPHAPPAPGRSL